MFAGMIDKECLPVGKNPLVGISLPVEVMGILAGAGNTQQFIINNVNLHMQKVCDDFDILIDAGFNFGQAEQVHMATP